MKKFLIILYILIFATLTYYVITLFIDRNNSETNTQEENKIGDSIEYSTESPIESSTDTLTDDELTDTPEITQKDAAYTITREDCDNECATIENTEKKSYCNQVCGFTTTEQSKPCDELSGLAKDYCLRDEAIANKELSKCNEITDNGIKKQCQNRINEDFIDEIM